jgi:hypothetical protein
VNGDRDGRGFLRWSRWWFFWAGGFATGALFGSGHRFYGLLAVTVLPPLAGWAERWARGEAS